MFKVLRNLSQTKKYEHEGRAFDVSIALGHGGRGVTPYNLLSKIRSIGKQSDGHHVLTE